MNAATPPTRRPACSASRYTEFQPELRARASLRGPRIGSIEPESSRARRKPWRRNGDGPWSRASQAAASTSATEPTARTAIFVLEEVRSATDRSHDTRPPDQEEARPDRADRPGRP